METIETQANILLTKGPSRVSPFMIPMLIVNMASGYISMLLGIKGPNLSVVSACATATHSIGEAARAIIHDDADVMIAGGTEATICRRVSSEVARKSCFSWAPLRLQTASAWSRKQ